MKLDLFDRCFLAVIIMLCLIMLQSCSNTAKEVVLTDKQAIVLAHNTSSSSSGRIYYHTIVKCSNNQYHDMYGLEYYVLPIGSKTSVDHVIELYDTQ